MSLRPGSEVDDTDRRTHCFTGKMSWAKSCNMNPHVYRLIHECQRCPWHHASRVEQLGRMEASLSCHLLELCKAWWCRDGACWKELLNGWCFHHVLGNVRSHMALSDQWDSYRFLMIYAVLQGPTFDQALRMTTADKNCTQTSKWLPCKKILS